jgi:hypothetical protein
MEKTLHGFKIVSTNYVLICIVYSSYWSYFKAKCQKNDKMQHNRWSQVF